MADISKEELDAQAQAALDEAKAKAQAAYDAAQAKAQELLDSLPTVEELLQSITLPSAPSKEEIVSKIVPGQMTNAELLSFLAPATISLPGLNVDTLLQVGFVTQYQELFAQIDSKEERQEIVDKYYDQYVTQNKEKLEKGIANIKSKLSASKDKLENLLKRVQNSIARIANPPVIGTAAPNPTRTVQDYIDMKQQAENELSAITVMLIDVILAADEIGYDLPEEFDVVAQLVGTTKKALELIPV